VRLLEELWHGVRHQTGPAAPVLIDHRDHDCDARHEHGAGATSARQRTSSLVVVLSGVPADAHHDHRRHNRHERAEEVQPEPDRQMHFLLPKSVGDCRRMDMVDGKRDGRSRNHINERQSDQRPGGNSGAALSAGEGERHGDAEADVDADRGAREVEQRRSAELGTEEWKEQSRDEEGSAHAKQATGDGRRVPPQPNSIPPSTGVHPRPPSNRSSCARWEEHRAGARSHQPRRCVHGETRIGKSRR